MLIRISLFLVFLLLATPCYAEKCYVYIDKIGVVVKDEEAGHTAYGDVVDICPYTPQYKPTRAELSRYRIFVTDLTQEEQELLTESIIEKKDNEDIVVKARKRSVDIDNMLGNQEQEIEKTILFDNTSTKP